MKTAEIITLSLAGLAGVVIGAIFFGGLWWTVLYGLKAKRPGLVFLLSLTVRFGLTLIGFYFVGGGDLERLVACLIGFIVSRAVIGWILQRSKSAFDSCTGVPLRANQRAPILHHSNTPSLQQPGAEDSLSAVARAMCDPAQRQHRKRGSAPQQERRRRKDDNEAPVERGGNPCI